MPWKPMDISLASNLNGWGSDRTTETPWRFKPSEFQHCGQLGKRNAKIISREKKKVEQS